MEMISINLPLIAHEVITEIAQEWRARLPSSVIEIGGEVSFVILPPPEQVSALSDIFICTYNPQAHLEKALADYYEYLKHLIETGKAGKFFLLSSEISYLRVVARINLEELLKAAPTQVQQAYAELPLVSRLVAEKGSPNYKENKRILNKLISNRSKSIRQQAGLREGRGRNKKALHHDIRNLIEGCGILSRNAAAKHLKVDRKTVFRRQQEAGCKTWDEYLDWLKKGTK